MKTKHIYLFISLFTIILFACGPETKEEKLNSYIEDGDNAGNKSVYTDAIEFSDALVGLDTKIQIKVLNLMKALEDQDIDQMREELIVVQKEILSATESLQKISCTKDQNDKFKNAAVSLFNCYNRIYFEDWTLILDEMDKVQKDENYVVDEDIYIKWIEGMQEEESLIFSVGAAQEDFAEENNFSMDDEDHPLDEEFNNL